jgi:opacity protein-like surface antigen
MRTHFSLVVLCTVALAMVVAPAYGQANRSDGVHWKIGPRFTADAGDISGVALGGALRVGSPSFPVRGSGALDLYLSEDLSGGDATVFTIDLNGQIPIEVEQGVLPYVGAGLGITRVSGSADGGSTTDLGVNLMGGAEVDLRVVNPFVQAQVTLGDQIDRLGITGGVLIDI